MELLVLGSLQVVGDDGPLPLAGGKQRALLAALLLRLNRPVGIGALLAAVWPDGPPASARSTLHVYASRLRRLLPGGADLVAASEAYVLRAEPDALDACRFERLLARARLALAGGAPADASRLASEAMRLWRGELLADLGEPAFLSPDRHRLDELRLAAHEVWADAELALGRHAEVLPELRSAVVTDPVRESGWARLMLALYRSGRQADALAAYRRARAALVEARGVEPGPALARMHADVLAQRPELDWVPAPGAPAQLKVPAVNVAEDSSGAGATAAALLSGARLVTLVGPAAGASRLALEVARGQDRGDGLRFLVDLGDLAEPGSVANAVAGAVRSAAG